MVPDQLHEDIERLTPVLQAALAEVVKENERRSKRRFVTVLVVLALIVAAFGGYLWNEDRAGCASANSARHDIRAGITGTLELIAHADGSISTEEADLIDANEANLVDDIPPRDC